MGLFLSLILSFFSLSSFACDISPEEMNEKLFQYEMNKVLKFQLPFETNGTVTKAEFESMVLAAKKYYTPVMKKLGFTFKINAVWEETDTNAYATQEGSEMSITLSGGYARIKNMSKDAYLTVICHEIGHHLGGFPKKFDSWASVEGQSDYFSTLKCAREILKRDVNNKTIALALNLPEVVKRSCRAQYPIDNDYYLCLRGAQASEDYGKALAAMKEQPKMPSLLTPARNVENETMEEHPEVQCRVDTKYQGSLCNVSPSVAIGEEIESIGTCHKSNGQRKGMRPMCWFKSGSL